MKNTYQPNTDNSSQPDSTKRMETNSYNYLESVETDWSAVPIKPKPVIAPVHESHPVGIAETVSVKVVPMWGFADPPEMEWTIPGIIPKDYMTTLAAHGGMGKSYLAIRLAISVALGQDFLGIPVKEGKVLYVDAELDVIEQQRRVNRVLEGLGLTNDLLKERMWYMRLPGPISNEKYRGRVASAIISNGITLTILDSLTIALGADASSQEVVSKTMTGLGAWGTVFLLDHVSNKSAQESAVTSKPFGSVMKHNQSRSVLGMGTAKGGGTILRIQKSNFGPVGDVIAYRTTFGQDAVSFNRIWIDDSSLDGGLHHLKSHEQTLAAVTSLYRQTGKPVQPEAVVSWRQDREDVTDVTAGTVRNQFSRLRQEGKISLDDGAIPQPTVEFFPPGSFVMTRMGEGEVVSSADDDTVLVSLKTGGQDVFLPQDVDLLF